MTTASAPLMAGSTLEELQGLGPAENLPAIQYTRKGASKSCLQQSAAQPSMLQGYKAAANLKDYNLEIDLLKVIDESEQEPSPGVSESEEDHDAAPRTLNISEKRKAQNSKFSAWLSQRVAKITNEEVQAVVENANEENLSIRSLMAKQESNIIITDPREYQLELFEKAKKQNIIAVLDTGSGKTLIAVLLLKHMIDKELEDRALGKKRRISFFLVDCVTLVFQQFAVLECNLDQKIERFCGEMGCDLWVKETWRKHFSENEVIVCTAEILSQCLMHSFISIDDINLLIFDEAHHTKKNHAYARIIKDYYVTQTDPAKRPKIFGMTASPVDAREDVVKAAKELEAMLHCQIATTSDLSLLRMSISRPDESLAVYGRLAYAYDTPLCSSLKAKFGDLDALAKFFRNAREAASQLGEWCADHLWRFVLEEEQALKVERKMERNFNRDSGNHPVEVLDAELARLKEAKEVVKSWTFTDPDVSGNSLSPKVLLLHKYLSLIFEKPSDAKCIIFVKHRYTARVLAQLFSRIGTPNLRLDLLIGSRTGDVGDISFSFRQQVLTLMKFRKGDINCLLATSIAEEGLDIPDCNLVIRFDLYDTLIQYIQSRGRARHANSRYIHMVEKDNRMHLQAVDEVRQGEVVMRNFCEALPADRLLQGNDYKLETELVKEKSYRKYVDPESGATLTYASSLVVLTHFVGCLPHRDDDFTHKATYCMSVQNKKFVCEVILPESSPIHSATGRPSSRKAIARRSAAFEACLLLRQSNHLDSNLIPTYHKSLPHMRNAHLALNMKKTHSYNMRVKPSLWEKTRGSLPGELFLTILSLETPENLGRPCQPLALMTRTRLPDIPPFPLHLQVDKVSQLLCTSISMTLNVNGTVLTQLNEFTLRIYYDIFNKTFEVNEPQMSYWLAPIINAWETSRKCDPPDQLIDWTVLARVSQHPDTPWTVDMPHADLIDRYLVDRWHGGNRYYSLEIRPDLKPSEPVPEGTAKAKHMDSIINYTISHLYKNSKLKVKWVPDQPVIRAHKIFHRLNLLDEITEKEKRVNTTAYLCPEPLRISALPTTVVAMAYLFPPSIHRIEDCLIALEACDLLGLVVQPALALEAVTKDSDNTDEHRSEQIHLQRGMGKNYERLEFIGDCFLKMATSISVFCKSPEENEYDYHVKRMLMICNKNLFNTATFLNLQEYIRSTSFSRRTWYPQGIRLLAGRGHNKTGEETARHPLGDKTIADVCEALIGASLLSHDSMDMAVKAVTALVSNPNHDVTQWDDYYNLYSLPRYQTSQPTASQLNLAMQVEQVDKYHFKYPRLLRSAFIHPSYPFAEERIPCYQRLEFLGDALLDTASISFLFHSYPDRDPQWLTEHKMAMVSNKFLAAVAVKLGFHKHLRSNGAIIESQNREYVQDLEEVEQDANGARDYWTLTKTAPKSLSDIVESYIGALFVDSEFNYGEVERFFNDHIKWFFEDMNVYDTYANNHPTTYLHNLLTLSFGCTNYRIMASEVPAIIPGGLPTAVAAVMIHDEIVAEGTASSGKNAKVKASSQALKLLQKLAPFEYRHTYGCNCEGKEQDWVGKAGDGLGMAGQLKRGHWDEKEEDLLRAKIAKGVEVAKGMDVR